MCIGHKFDCKCMLYTARIYTVDVDGVWQSSIHYSSVNCPKWNPAIGVNGVKFSRLRNCQRTYRIQFKYVAPLFARHRRFVFYDSLLAGGG